MSDLARPKNIAPIRATVQEFSSRLNRRNLQDVFAFTYRRRRSLHLTLSGIRENANADVLLLNSRKRVIKRSQLGKGFSESITANLAKGNYFIQVILKGRQATRYQLKVATENTPPVFQAGDRFLPVPSGTAVAITNQQLQTTDTLQAPDQLKYRLTRLPINGVLSLNGVPLGQEGWFTQADINAGRLKYTKTVSDIPTVIASTGNPDSMGFPTEPLVSGVNVTWYAPGGIDGGTDTEIFFYDGKTVRQITQNNSTDFVSGIHGSTLFYSSQVGTAGALGATWEIFAYNDTTKATTRLTNNAFDDIIRGVSGGHVYWSNNSGVGNTHELFHYDSNTGAIRQLTSNALMDVFGGFDNGNATWTTVQPNNSLTVSYFDSQTGLITQVTDQASDHTVKVHGSKVGYYRTTGNGTRDLFLYDVSTGITTRLTDNTVHDFFSGMTHSDLFWESAIGINTTTELFRYNLATGTLFRLTNNNVDDSFAPGGAAFSGSNALWLSVVGTQANGQATRDLFYGSSSDAAIRLTHHAEGAATLFKTLTGDNILWSSDVGPIRNGEPTNELFYWDGVRIRQLTHNAVRDDSFSASDKAIAWRSAEAVDHIYYYAMGDSFEWVVEDGRGGATSPHRLEVIFQ